MNPGWGVREGQGMEGRPPRGAHAASAAPPPHPRMPPHPPRPLLLLTDPSGVQCGARWLCRGWGPLSCREQPVHWNRACSEPPRVLSLVLSPCLAPRVLCLLQGPSAQLTASQPLILAQTLHQGPTCSALCRMKLLGLLGSVSSSSAPQVTAGTSPLCPQSRVSSRSRTGSPLAP